MSAMSQQVNLLIDDLRPQRTLLTPGQVLVGVAVFALALVALFAARVARRFPRRR